MRRKKPTTPDEIIASLQDEVAKTHAESAFIKTALKALVRDLRGELPPDTYALLIERVQSIFERSITAE